MGGNTLQFVNAFLLLFLAHIVVGDATTDLPPDDYDGPGEGHEGDDMILLPGQEAMMQSSRKAISSSVSRWSEVGGYPEVPYTFADALVNQTKVKLAIAHWEEHTCLKFPEVASSSSKYHIIFQRHAQSCNSYIGYVGWHFTAWAGQPINVPLWCENSFGSLVHEIGHAIGFFHEQSRSDRDDHVKINMANIISSATNNFRLAADNNYDVPYDFNSDMHYFDTAFTTNGRITIATKNPFYQGVIGQRTGLSHMDKLLANRMYNCISKNLASCSRSVDPCQNYGYLGKNCACVCPDGTSGTNCETKTTDYNDVNLSSFSENITSPGTVTSPNHPSTTPGGVTYAKWIQAPVCQLIRLTFIDFTAFRRTNFNGQPICRFEGLEIRTSNLYDGNWYCDNDITSGQIFTSTTNQMILFFRAIGGASPARWSATVAFISDPACTSSPTTTVSPATPASNVCPSKDLGGGRKAFNSPDYPKKYPNNARCVHENDNKMLYLAILTIKLKLNRGDKIIIENPYGPPITLKGSRRKPMVKMVPAYFRATFTSDGSRNQQGFRIEYRQMQGRCHESIDGTTPGVVTSPGYPKKHNKKTVCEWKITVSPGKRVRLAISLRGVSCRMNYLAVDKTPYDTFSYVPAAIVRLCGTRTVNLISDTNVVSVFYNGPRKAKGVSVSYSEVS